MKFKKLYLSQIIIFAIYCFILFMFIESILQIKTSYALENVSTSNIINNREGENKSTQELVWLNSTIYDYYSDNEHESGEMKTIYANNSFSIFNSYLINRKYVNKVGTLGNNMEQDITRVKEQFPLYLGKFYNDMSERINGNMYYPVNSKISEDQININNAKNKNNNMFLYANSSQNTDNVGVATQNLVDNKLKNGKLTQSEGSVNVPYFDDEFITSKISSINLPKTSNSYQYYIYVKSDNFTPYIYSWINNNDDKLSEELTEAYPGNTMERVDNNLGYYKYVIKLTESQKKLIDENDSKLFIKLNSEPLYSIYTEDILLDISQKNSFEFNINFFTEDAITTENEFDIYVKSGSINPNLYSWIDYGNNHVDKLLGEWPGTLMESIENKSGYYKSTIKLDENQKKAIEEGAKLYIIFNKDGKQTNDFLINTSIGNIFTFKLDNFKIFWDYNLISTKIEEPLTVNNIYNYYIYVQDNTSKETVATPDDYLEGIVYLRVEDTILDSNPVQMETIGDNWYKYTINSAFENIRVAFKKGNNINSGYIICDYTKPNAFILSSVENRDNLNCSKTQYYPDWYSHIESKKGSLGVKYENVKFPMRVKKENGFTHYTFNSNEDVLRLDDKGMSTYYYNENKVYNPISAKQLSDIAGYFPFNNSDNLSQLDSEDAIKQYNYGIGTRIEFEFYLTKNGKLKSNNLEEDIQFLFFGDDDLWIYIDDILVLDIGGAHNKTNGSINFANKKSVADYIKIYDENMYTGGKIVPVGNEKSEYDLYYKKGEEVDFNSELKEKMLDENGDYITGKKHKLTMFYIERGEGDSNLFIDYNLILGNSQTIFGKKIWNDINNQLKIRPTTYEIKMFAKGENLTEKTFNSSSYIWNYERKNIYSTTQIFNTDSFDENEWMFENLPIYDDNGNLIEYCYEETLPNYYNVLYNNKENKPIYSEEYHNLENIITNTLDNNYNINFTKVDIQDKTPLENAKFELRRTNKGEEETNELMTFIKYSDKNGNISFSELIPGIYELKEIEAPSGYNISKKTYKIVIKKDEISFEGKKVNTDILDDGTTNINLGSIGNKKGAILPIAGDKGRIIFYQIGLLFITMYFMLSGKKVKPFRRKKK